MQSSRLDSVQPASWQSSMVSPVQAERAAVSGSDAMTCEHGTTGHWQTGGRASPQAESTAAIATTTKLTGDRGFLAAFLWRCSLCEPELM